MSFYNRKLCISNVYYLTKIQGKKLGDVETSAGVSPGYFSRLNKEDSTANPSIEALASVAFTLGVTVDALISRDYSSMSESERFVMDFLDKLIVASHSGEKIWTRESTTYLKGLSTDEDGDPVHPLFQRFYNNAYNCWDARFTSLFFPGSDYRIADDCFTLNLGDSSDLYLMKVNTPEGEDTVVDTDEYELYAVNCGVPETICRSSMYGNHVFADALETLYAAASESSKHVKLSDNVKNVITAFMNGQQPSFEKRQQKSLPATGLGFDDDGELPF